MQPDEQLALNNCDQEPVHIPGRIQPFGAMLGFDLKSGEVRYQSENLGSVLFDDDDTVHLGSTYEDVIGNREITHSIRGALGLPTIRIQRDRVGVFDLNGRQIDVSVYSTPETCVVEFEPDHSSPDRPQSPVAMVRSMMSAVSEGAGVQQLLDTCVRALRHLTGHDRVMAYKFFENGDGEVIAEAKGPGIEPYLGLRYPAWDIPTQVRQIMLRAPFRVIADIHAQPAGLLTSPGAPPLDMTLAHSRGVSPIHVEYLENMGVRATMNTSIIVRGRLWGLFAFHHSRPRTASPDQRSICELFGHLASMMVQKEEEQHRLTHRQKTRSTVESMNTAGPTVEAVIDSLADEFMRAVSCDGVGLVAGSGTRLVGETTTGDIAQELAERTTDELIAIDSLKAVKGVESTGKTAGVLMLRLPRDQSLAFFRNEVVHEIRWAGGKEKQITVGPNGPRLTPRGSFAEYKESVAGRCRPWTETDLNSASEICRELWKIMQVTSEEQSRQLARQKRYQDLLIAELNHRVRNTLALVRSIARQTTSSSVSIEQYVEMLEQRIATLSMAHDLIGGSGLQWARISDLVRAELKPYEFDTQHVTVEGPPVAVRADVAPVLALLFHEMASNAVKHGALSGSGGSLNVRWRDEAGGVAIEWTEKFDNNINEPERRGFGFALIERALPFECDGKSSISFGDKQLDISFWLPADAIDSLAETATQHAVEAEPPPPLEMLDLSEMSSAMVLEDNMVLAMELERSLLDLGIKSVDTLPNAQLASEALDRASYDCAVLDINLGETTSFEIAERLWRSGTGVVLASGYDSKYELPETLSRVPRITKPIGRLDLVNAIHTAVKECGS